MKFIPLDSFETINSLLQDVEAQGCLVTLQLSAFTCRHTREERQLANSLAQYQSAVQTTPPISPVPAHMAASAKGAFSLDALPEPLVLGSAVSSADALAYLGAPSTPVTADSIDDRLVFFVAALNSLYAADGYDFSVLTENDFIAHSEANVRNVLQQTLQSLPLECEPAVQRFWAAVEEQVEDEAHGCEFYEFASPSCDPHYETSVFSHHFILFNRRRKVLVTVVLFGQGNQYRGDDGFGAAGTAALPEGFYYDTDEGTRTYASSPEPLEEEEAEYGGKNREFYGY